METPSVKIRKHVLERSFFSDAHTEIRANHLGYMPASPKFAVLDRAGTIEFQLIECQTGAVALRRTVSAQTGDFGPSMVFDFSAVTRPGTYYIAAGAYRSFPIRIAMDALDEAIEATVGYFAAQRCGPSETGYHTPCHVEDGIRADNGEYRDVSGGWHDASDLRKWVSATIDGMVGLAKVYELCGDVKKPGGIFEELRWGNRYFLNMQEPDGYVMAHCGGDVYAHSDSNHWTDNVRGTEDDRVIQVKPAEMACQLRFIAAQGMTARIARAHGDDAYAARCLEAARRCYSWCAEAMEEAQTAEVYGDGITACVEMARATGEAAYLDTAANWAEKAMALQAWDEEAARGFFRTSLADAEPYRNICGDPLGIALGMLIEQAPEHADAPRWRECLKRWAEAYVEAFAGRNGYGLIPYGLYERDAGGGRAIGRYYYRYFMGLHDRMEIDGTAWWTGVNANIAAMGIALARAARIMNRPEWMETAQRQLDWILGCNPFDDCHVDLVGRNRHQPFLQSYYVPGTPRIRGAVLNGIGGDEGDMPCLWDGTYHTCEYWTPMVCHTMWLAATLKASYGKGSDALGRHREVK